MGMHIRQRLGGWQAGGGKGRKRWRSIKVGTRLVSRPRTAVHLPAANRRYLHFCRFLDRWAAVICMHGAGGRRGAS
jgi:hypothetical protein